MKRTKKNFAVLALAAAALILSVCTSPVVRNADTKDDLIPGRHDQLITTLRFTRDSGRFFSASMDGTVSVWDVRGGLLKTLTGYYDNHILLDVSPGGTMALASKKTPHVDTTARSSLWNVEKGLVKRLPFAMAAKFLGENEVLVYHTGELALYRCDDGKLIRTMPVNSSHEVILGNTGAFAVDDKKGRMLLYKRLGSGPRTLPARGTFECEVFSADDGIFAALHTNETRESGGFRKSGVKAWRANGVPVADFWHADVRKGVFSMDGKGERFFLMSANSINAFDRKGMQTATYRTGDHANKEYGDYFEYRASSGNHVAVFHRNTLFIFTGDTASAKIHCGDDRFTVFDLSPDGRFAVLGSSRGSVHLWSARGSRVMRTADISRPLPSDFMQKPDEFSVKDKDIVVYEGMRGIWVNRNTFRTLAIGQPKDGAPEQLKMQYARDAAYRDGMKKMIELFINIRFEDASKMGGLINYYSTAIAWRREFRPFQTAGTVVSEKYNEYGVCHAVVELNYPNLRRKVEMK